MDGILHGFFSERERKYLRSRAPGERTRIFFLLWTRRESAAKAMGIGLFHSFARLDLPPSDLDRSGFRLAVPQPGTRSGGTESWWIRDLVPAPGCAGALCVEGRNPDPSFWLFAAP
jgi:phosphopantetheinyl transferase